MNERIEKLIKVTKERMRLNNEDKQNPGVLGSDNGLSNFFELRDRLEDLLEESEIAELDTAWEAMLKEIKLEEWDEDFLKAIDGSYESQYLYGYATKRQEKLNNQRREAEQKMQQEQILEEMRYRNALQNQSTVQRRTSGTGAY